MRRNHPWWGPQQQWAPPTTCGWPEAGMKWPSTRLAVPSVEEKRAPKQSLQEKLLYRKSYRRKPVLSTATAKISSG